MAVHRTYVTTAKQCEENSGGVVSVCEGGRRTLASKGCRGGARRRFGSRERGKGGLRAREAGAGRRRRRRRAASCDAAAPLHAGLLHRRRDAARPPWSRPRTFHTSLRVLGTFATPAKVRLPFGPALPFDPFTSVAPAYWMPLVTSNTSDASFVFMFLFLFFIFVVPSVWVVADLIRVPSVLPHPRRSVRIPFSVFAIVYVSYIFILILICIFGSTVRCWSVLLRPRCFVHIPFSDSRSGPFRFYVRPDRVRFPSNVALICIFLSSNYSISVCFATSSTFRS